MCYFYSAFSCRAVSEKRSTITLADVSDSFTFIPVSGQVLRRRQSVPLETDDLVGYNAVISYPHDISEGGRIVSCHVMLNTVLTLAA